MVEQPKQHGGKREGAGRKKKEAEPRKTFGASLTQSFHDQVLSVYPNLGDAIRELWKEKYGLR